MNRRLSTILLIAFVIAAAASYVVYRISGSQASRTSPTGVTQVVTAARDLPIGSVISDMDVAVGDWVGTVPEGAIVSKTVAVGRGVVSQIYKGEPILTNRLAAMGAGGGLAATIRPGMRACAVRVDDVVGVAGFVLPGMRVDVLMSGTPPGANSSDGPKVRTLLQNIEVLSAGNDIQKDNEGKPQQVQVVNLLVTPEQAEVLSLASNQTKIQLVLRNPLDGDTAKTTGVAMASLFSDGAPKPAPKAVARRRAPAPPPPPPPPAVQIVQPPPAKIYVVQVLNGDKQSEEKFSEPVKQ